jgi:superfamily I DNA/RNA helicase
MITQIDLDPGQMKAVNSTAERLVVRATPGAGKTVILQEIAKAHVGQRILYITFSKAMADEAKTRLPPGVDAMTFHAMTFRALRQTYGHKFKGSEVTPHEAGKLFGITPDQMDAVYLAMSGLSLFMYGDSEVPGMAHLPPASADYGSGDRMKVLQLMRRIWARMIDPNDPMPISHDSGAKLFQTRMYSIPYDVILFDEYQDSSVSMLKTLDQQSARIVLVGDPFQSIHKYRGAVGDLDGHFRADAIVKLRRSYRFGEFIAEAAKSIINAPGMPLTEIIGSNAEPGLVITPDMLEYTGQKTTLFRTNAGLFEYLDDFLIDNPDGKIALIGGAGGYSTHDLLQMFNFVSGNHRWVKDPFLLSFRNVRELEEHANAHGLNDVLSRLRLVRRYGKDFPLLIRRIEAACVSNPAQADIHAGNVHKAKGQEFDVVALGDDFPSIWDRSGDLNEEERNVLYVAATRAKRILFVNKVLDDIYSESLVSTQKA